MDQLIEKWRDTSLRQRITAGGGIAVTLVLLVLMVRMVMQPPMTLLYAGLDPMAAGEVITALDSETVDYDVRGNSIYVPADVRDTLRLSLAAQSLPSPSTEGYELLDRLDGFSTTSEMFDVAYWRAKEGELARTLMTIPGVKAARVHIGAGDRGAFARRSAKRTASVTVTAPAGLDENQVRAVRYLTALAIPNLQSEDVAIIDTARGLLSQSNDVASVDGMRRAKSLEQDLLELLEARVGIGNARVNVAMDVVRRREEIEERAFDPNQSVITSQSREESRSRENDENQPVTIASDLPDGEIETEGQTSESTEVREDISYAVSSTDRRVELLPGGIERLSVAVLLNTPIGEEGEPIPRTPEELEALSALVAAAAGIDEERGDRLTIEALPFEKPAALAQPGLLDQAAQWPIARISEVAILSVSLLLFGLFVLRPLLNPSTVSAAVDAPTLELEQIGDPAAGSLAPVASAQTDPVALLRDMSRERSDDAATLLNAWLEEEEAA